jgi:Alpha amylase, catalytic domain
VPLPSPRPSIYEINTRVWLSALSESSQRPVDLSTVPPEEWDAIAAYGFDAVWLMGVWERSAAGRAIATQNQSLVEDLRRALPDFVAEDNVGSAYCVRRYVVDDHLGGPEGLAAARRELAQRGIGLLLDFVPNHVAPDSPWILEHPDHFIEGTATDLQNHPGSYVAVGKRIFACGRDPYFPPWSDVVQVNVFAPELRAAVIQQILDIGAQCDGIRCDMAMLLINRIFSQTWGAAAGPMPATEYWPEVIDGVKEKYPNFLFLAEAYWYLEWVLQQQGFDFCYDKRFYDRLEHGDAEGIRLHLGADLSYQEKLVRFLENHDEPRSATVFPPGKVKAAAVAIVTVPGAKLFHEGQFEGRKIWVPVFLRRRPQEPVDADLQAFYRRLLAAVNQPLFHEGRWALCSCSGWPDNQTSQNLLAWCWIWEQERCLVLINLSDGRAQSRVRVPWNDIAGRLWRLADALSVAVYERDGDEIQQQGLYVDLAPWAGHIFTVRSVTASPSRNLP